MLSERTWMRHANPWSVWTRYAAFPALLAAVWSHHWIGWWSLAPIAAVVAFLAVNPRLFPPPRSTKSWASMAVLGERVWVRERYRLPAEMHPMVHWVVLGLSGLSALALVWGLATSDIVVTVGAAAAVIVTKSWLSDRMVWLFRERSRHNPEYASWFY
jgi:hypothetical protein